MLKVTKHHKTDEQPEGSDPLAEMCYESDTASPIYTWCLHCEQVYPTKEWRKKKREGSGTCPNCGELEECDSLPWQQVRLERKEYPPIPTIGLTYPLHGWDEQIN